MDQRCTPLYTALLQHHQASPTSFHVPGHKNGKVISSEAKDIFTDIMKIDVTELSGLDDLHSPTGVIKEAQELTANFYGVENSYFLVGGSTAGNLAMILAVCDKGDVVLVQRNCHKSIIHGLQLAGVTPVFLSPFIEEKGQIPVGVTTNTIQNALQAYQHVKAVILTYPNYYGMAMKDTKEIIELAHHREIPILVDEAHGAHFCLKGPFPPSSIELGADLVVQSAHKTLPAMTMGSFLHVNSKLINRGKLEFYLQAIQSSSPSYPIMASLDLARYYVANFPTEQLDDLHKSVDRFIEALNAIPQIRTLSYKNNIFTNDKLKVTIQSQCQLTGFEIQAFLEKSGIYTELADPYHVLLIVPLEASFDFHGITTILKDELATFEVQKKIPQIKRFENDCMTLALSFEEMANIPTTFISLKEANGFISASHVIPYPPGIPVIMKGEKITTEHMLYIEELKHQGASFQRENELWTKGIEVFDL